MIDHEAARRTVEEAKEAGKIIATEPLPAPVVVPKPRKKHMKKSQRSKV